MDGSTRSAIDWQVFGSRHPVQIVPVINPFNSQLPEIILLHFEFTVPEAL